MFHRIKYNTETKKLRYTFQSKKNKMAFRFSSLLSRIITANPRGTLNFTDKFVLLKRSKFHQYLFLIFIHTIRELITFGDEKW